MLVRTLSDLRFRGLGNTISHDNLLKEFRLNLSDTNPERFIEVGLDGGVLTPQGNSVYLIDWNKVDLSR